jgi:hypothetical protein
MNIYFDENIPHQIAKALNILQEPCKEQLNVLNISEIFGRGAKDEEWIPKIAEENAVVITQDLNIHHTHQQRELYRKYKLGVVFLKSPSKTGYKYWQMVNKLITSWDDIKKIIQNKKRPFAYILKPRSSHLEEL